MSLPRQLRFLLKWGVALASLAVLVLAILVAGYLVRLRQRVDHAQQLYDTVVIGDPWRGLEGFEERTVVSDPGSQVPPFRRYWRMENTFFLPIIWEIAVGMDGSVVGKHRYD